MPRRVKQQKAPHQTRRERTLTKEEQIQQFREKLKQDFEELEQLRIEAYTTGNDRSIYLYYITSYNIDTRTLNFTGRLPPHLGDSVKDLEAAVFIRKVDREHIKRWSQDHNKTQNLYAEPLIKEFKWAQAHDYKKFKATKVTFKVPKSDKLPEYSEDIKVWYDGPTIEDFGVFVRQAVAWFYTIFEVYCLPHNRSAVEKLAIRQSTPPTPDNFIVAPSISREDWNKVPPVRNTKILGPFNYDEKLKKQFPRFIQGYLNEFVKIKKIPILHSYVPRRSYEMFNSENLPEGPDCLADLRKGRPSPLEDFD